MCVSLRCLLGSHLPPLSIKLSGAGFPARSTKKSFFVERAGKPVSQKGARCKLCQFAARLASSSTRDRESVYQQRVCYSIQNLCQVFRVNAYGQSKKIGLGIHAAVEFDRAFA